MKAARRRDTRSRLARCLLLGAALSWSLLGCAARTQIRIDSAPNVNEQRSVYVLVRTVDEASYRTESYDEVAARVVHPDDSVQIVAVALPGVRLAFTLPAPSKGKIAVYALFERPRCGAWRVLLPPNASSAVNLRLSDGQLCLVDERGACVPTPCTE